MPDKTDSPAAPFPSNIEIAQRAQLRPIVPLAQERLGIPPDNLEPYGHYKAKVSLDYLAQLADRPDIEEGTELPQDGPIPSSEHHGVGSFVGQAEC